MTSGTPTTKLLDRLSRMRVIRTFTDEANRLSAGIVTAERASPRAVDRVFKAYTIAFLLRGSGTLVNEAGASYPLRAGDMVQRLPDRRHTLIRTDDGRWLEFFLVLPRSLFESLAGLGVLDARRDVLHPGVDGARVDRIARFVEWLGDNIDADPGGALLEAQRLLLELYAHDRSRRRRSPEAAALAQACFQLRQNPAERVSMPEVAAACGMGYDKFRKLFARAYGISPKQYRMRYRIDAAKRMLLEQRLSTKEIAYALGYSEVANFANQFARATGLSPGQYRERG